MKHVFLTFIFIALAIPVSFRLAYLWRLLPPSPNAFGEAVLDGAPLSLEFAKSEEERERGLSRRGSLAPESGMLFLLPAPALQGIWMKDMRFPLDILWFDGEKHVVFLKENALPSSYPEIFTPSQPARYILEVNAGFIAQNHVALGDMLVPRTSQK